MAEEENSDSDGPLIDDNVIRIQLRKPHQRKWELRTRNHSPSVRFPTIQLFDCEGNLLVETNDENISIKSTDRRIDELQSSKSLREKDYRHNFSKITPPLKKSKTVSGGKIFTRIFGMPNADTRNSNKTNVDSSYIIRNIDGIQTIPMKNSSSNKFLLTNGIENSPFTSEGISDLSSFKSSDNDSEPDNEDDYDFDGPKAQFNKYIAALKNENDILTRKKYLKPVENVMKKSLNKSKSFVTADIKEKPINLRRSASGLSTLSYDPPSNRVSFINTYLKSLPTKEKSNPEWLTNIKRRNYANASKNTDYTDSLAYSCDRSSMQNGNICKYCKWDNTSENDFANIPTDVAADYELKKRLKMYRRGISEIEPRHHVRAPCKRRLSLGDSVASSSSSESVDEADVVLNRLRRRILKNKLRERKRGDCCQSKPRKSFHFESSEDAKDEANVAKYPKSYLETQKIMGSNISQHSTKGLKGRRARSSGDLCNGETKSQTDSTVCGSVVGDVMGWNRSLPNHLDGNRHLADYSRVNNNYAEFGTYKKRQQKGGRGLRYRVFKTGSDADPVWKLQDPGCDQGYGSERSPEDDYAPPLPPVMSLDEYEAQLRALYPFINEENTFTVVVEKDGRGLGMSVCGGGGLVRIRRLYPPQPAWRTGQLAPKDLLLAANGVPLGGLSTYEALEVLRTAASRVELRVCRPPPDVLESVTPPDPPTPPARTPHPPHLPAQDPLNCHPLHARLSATTSSATTSSSEGRGRREASPEDRRELHLPGLERPLPVFDVQYGDDGSVEFDIVMTKVNGSLGFTLRKEDHSALGHYVRALVREPALSDGRIQPGDRIIEVNDTPMSNMSHAEAVAHLRACDSEVRLRLYRDHAATPLSPTSPREEGPTDSDTPHQHPKSKTPLRAEAVSMLCDLAARRLTPEAADGSRSPCLSPRKFRRLTKDNNHYEIPNDMTSTKFRLDSLCIDGCTDIIIIPEARPKQRTRSESYINSTTTLSRKQKLSLLSVPPQNYHLNNIDQDTLDAPNIYKEDQPRFPEAAFPVDSDEPVSMPVDFSSDEGRFKHATPAYQSAVLHISTTAPDSGSNNDSNREDGKGLKKWKGVTLSPDNERKVIIADAQPKITNTVQKENVKPEVNTAASDEPTVVTVELNRGWNSRLGFSVQSHPDSGQSYISAVYSDSVAARDGRLRQGDVILQVNDENVTSMKTPEVIDLLRILRGSICITVLRPPNSRAESRT